MVGPPYNPAAVRAAHTLLRHAHDDWTANLHRLRPDDADDRQADLRLRLYGSAAAVLLWTRGIDDMCTDPDGHQPYVAARPAVAPRLSAARYAGNHAIHQLIPLSDLDSGGATFPMTFPRAFRPPTLRWATEIVLPPVDIDSTRKLRRVYLATWAGHAIGPTLDQLRAWFDEQLA